MQIRRTRVQIHTEQLQITGTLQLPGEGYRSRVTDFLNTHDSGFIALIDAEVAPADGSPTQMHPFLAVGARHIVAMTETEDLGFIEDASSSPGLADYRSPSSPPPSS
jgi:hypothetical protein